ncbi:hypothetical protein [Nocardia transvalensis]|uniref:hypothetical protein n=1 Tax=Nocardia transvalensis TaxID=37333 RepID=UPI001895C772|nr:hypothetical protein [Nocardia transvalensis]MBF6333604.1 hypothetical protein [Nocardia transvalensis]
MSSAEVEQQIYDSLDERVVGALEALGWLDLADLARQRLDKTVPMLAAQLTQDDDDQLAAQTVNDLAGVAWDADPEPEWWRTPVGRLVARSVGREDSEAVTHHVAAAMLGVTRGTIAQLVHRGTLDRHPDGGVTRASVLNRLVRKK